MKLAKNLPWLLVLIKTVWKVVFLEYFCGDQKVFENHRIDGFSL